MFSSSWELLGPPLPQKRKRKEKTLRRTFPNIPGSQALQIPTAFGIKWLLIGGVDWLPGPGQAQVNSRTGCQGTGGLCSQRQGQSLGHVQYWPEMRPRSRPPDCLSTFFSLSFRQLPHDRPNVNFKNKTIVFPSAALCHRPDEGFWLLSSF